MRIAIIGAGGIGAIYGAALARSGVEVAFVARGAHLAAMQANGLRIEGDRGETLIRPAWATDDIASIGAGRLCAALRQIVGCRDRRRAASALLSGRIPRSCRCRTGSMRTNG